MISTEVLAPGRGDVLTRGEETGMLEGVHEQQEVGEGSALDASAFLLSCKDVCRCPVLRVQKRLVPQRMNVTG